jgi:hypothetical protein
MKRKCTIATRSVEYDAMLNRVVELINEAPAPAPHRRRMVSNRFALFHRKLRGLVVIDLKRGRFTYADAIQMHMYLDCAREHWTRPGENPPVALILCTEKDEAIAHYALDGLPNKILATEYRTVLPDEKLLAAEIEGTRRQLEARTTRRKSWFVWQDAKRGIA